jgi:ABC-2 type transport system permease protein
MFKDIWTKTLRDYRWGILWWALGLLAYMYVGGYVSFQETAQGPDYAATFTQLAQTFKFLGDPVAITTPGGFTLFRVGAISLLFLSIWAVMAGARLVRGEETRGSIDVLLSTPQSRTTLLLQKTLALAVAFLVVGLGVALSAIIGESADNVQISAGGALLEGLDFALGAFLFAMLALFISQLVRLPGTAAGIAGGIMVATYLIDGLSRVVDGATGVRYISPFYYFGLNKPLIDGYAFNPWGMLMLLAGSLLFLGFSVALFARREIDGVAFPSLRLDFSRVYQNAAQALAAARRNLSLQSVGLRSLRAQLASNIWWIAGIAVYSVYGTGIAKATKDTILKLVNGSPFYKQFFGADIASDKGFVSAVVFLFVPVLVAAMALTQSGAWSQALDNGREDLILSAPQPRWKVLLQSYAALLVPIVLSAVACWLAVIALAAATGLHLNGGSVAAASLAMIPLGLITASAVYLLSIWLRSGVVLGIAGGALAISFVLSIFGAILKLPEWAQDLSIFHVYGTPMLNDINWGGTIAMLIIAAAALTGAVVTFQRSDLTRSA